MNETMNTLLSRRSIRSYKAEQIKDDELNTVLKAGMYAPTGSNKQSPLFVVVQDKETLAKIVKMNAEIMGKDTNPYYGAPTIVLVFADTTKTTWFEDGCLALGNMFNAAASVELGSCWIHRVRQMFETEEGKVLMRTWGVGEEFAGIGSCALGYPDCPLPEASPRKAGYVIYA